MQASFSTVLTKVSSASRIPFTLASSKPQASSLRATSRRDESNVISSPISNMTDQTIVTTLLSKKSSVTFVAFTSSPELQTPYLSVTSRLPNTVTFLLTPGASSVVRSSTFSLRASVTTSLLFSVSFAAESMSSRTALSFESSTFTILASKLSSSRASTALYKTSLMTRVPSSRFSQVSTSVILQRSSRSTFSTSSPTSSVKFTSTISSVVSAKSSLVSRMSTPYMSTFASRKSDIIFNSSFKSSISLSFVTSGSFIDTASLFLSRTIVTPFILCLLSFKSQNVTSSLTVSTPFLSVSLSIFVTSSSSRKVISSLSFSSTQDHSSSFISLSQLWHFSKTFSFGTHTFSVQPIVSSQSVRVFSFTFISFPSKSQTLVLATTYSPKVPCFLNILVLIPAFLKLWF